ncbi:MAG: transcription-repair coupling factor [Deltaproteobacteria bacterium]|nr:transcription-repair coupling factor [Deltaproteobacteria bacterium]|tara:strand:+ start:17452 stop:21132 length:3681 start_codon:yes stop_codon:yes gene_type:complete
MSQDRKKLIQEPSLWGGGTVEELVNRVKHGASRMVISGVRGGGLAFLAGRMIEAMPERAFVLVAASHQKAFQWYEELLFYMGVKHQESSSRVLYYPADEVLPYSEMLPDRGAMQSRMGALLKLQEKQHPVLVMPVAALARRVTPAKELSSRSDLIVIGEEEDRDIMLEKLVASGYRRTPVVEDRGTFSVRGGTIDIFSPLYRNPLRIEFDDVIVESIRFFDPNTQRTLEEVEEILIGPVDEIFVTKQNLPQIRSRLATIADELEFPTKEFNQLIDDLSSGMRPFGLQALMPGFHDELCTLFDYTPRDTVFFVEEPHDVHIELQQYFARMQGGYESLTSGGGLAFSPEHFLLTTEELEAALKKQSRVEHKAVLVLDEAKEDEETVEESSDGPALEKTEDGKIRVKAQVRRATWGSAGELVLPFATDSHMALKQHLQSIPVNQDFRFQPLVDKIRGWRDERIRVVIVCGAKGQALRLIELLELYDMSCRLWEDSFHFDIERFGKGVDVDIFIGRIMEGFLFPRAYLCVISEEEIFGPKARRRKSKKKSPLHQMELHTLETGDFIIHKEHGLARYGGLHTITIGGVTSDFVLLEYKGKDKLYLPVTRLSQIERYTGGGTPSIDRLKSNSFEKKKGKARNAIRAMAGELIQLYAERKARVREPYPIPDDMYAQFESSFPFVETTDQLQAIEDITEDMKSHQVMDRLICGDVGYGKTEVAMRAAFHAVFSGKQVGVLVPTTVLAQQHGLTFRERFAGYPVKIGVLSRFQTNKEKKKVAEQLKEGALDIVVGTHRLLSRDIHFKDLGLLIIDEEHRFGVRHKERIKQMRKMLDVLTLTATPIPRTLEMSMMGIRDLSLITTPPHDRLAIRTTIAPFNDQVIRETVMRELNRGGQVFFVHNRVESIGKLKIKLEALVPEARCVIAHGQMPESELERVMLDFIEGRFNLLLCTSIVESGLDIPRANTMLVDRADAFGLAQLYQIRGRVGRGKERAYAVLLVPANRRVTPEAKQRLSTLQRFSELGAGFEIARQDLELRGAGNILGKEQSGHVHAIGMELYFEMLEEAINELQGKPVRPKVDPEVKLGLDAYIPDSFIPDIQLRLQCYRRLSSAETVEELDELSSEFQDRFGPVPLEVDALFQMTEIKQMLMAIDATAGTLSGSKFRVFFHPEAPLDLDRLMVHAQKKDAPFRLLPNHGLETTEPLSGGELQLKDIRQFLRTLPDLIMKKAEETS